MRNRKYHKRHEIVYIDSERLGDTLSLSTCVRQQAVLGIRRCISYDTASCTSLPLLATNTFANEQSCRLPGNLMLTVGCFRRNSIKLCLQDNKAVCLLDGCQSTWKFREQPDCSTTVYSSSDRSLRIFQVTEIWPRTWPRGVPVRTAYAEPNMTRQ